MGMSGPPFDVCNSEFEHSTLFLILILAIFRCLSLFYFPRISLLILLSCFDLFRMTSQKHRGVFDKLSVYSFEIFSTVTPKTDATSVVKLKKGLPNQNKAMLCITVQILFLLTS